MSYEVHLGRFSEELEEVPISRQEWLACVNKFEELKFVEEEYPASIQAYSEQYLEWIPVFWIRDDGSGFMRASGFFESDVSYEKAIEIATYLKAYIYGDEEEIYFLPGYGIVYDDVERENPELHLEDLRRYKNEYGNDFEKIIAAVNQKKADEKKKRVTTNATTSVKISKPKSQSKLWLLFIVIIAAVLIIVYLI